MANPTGLSHTEFLSILTSDCAFELTENAESTWNAATTKAWEKIRSSPSTSLHQFIVSVSTGSSGYDRRQSLLSMASGAGEGSFALAEYPISNSRDKTYFLLASTADTIQTISTSSSADGMKIQPYLPMMKIRVGTLDQIRSSFGRNGFCVIASFGPSTAGAERDDAFVEGIKQRLRQLTSSEINAYLKESFPKTSSEVAAVDMGSILACLSKAVLDGPDGTLSFLFGSLASFDAAISFVASLALLTEVNSIEIQGEIYLM
eukprot:CAMPEP_0116033636 /NCGR_PEP_ID=MMETSP0321-20121206/19120_1 /TAXON_ID=163516 /ORGANISM="Leptocylindrus danicus var. danicus, Strain B650" /LENGTH=260 /DNA_ID=CAMNT_0003509775 /DNA_START=23 /DNA_END=805 /DNA_ORIENTATION=+